MKKLEKPHLGQSRPLYKLIANALQAKRNCEESGNWEWRDKWNEKLDSYQELLPSGSGFDSGSEIDIDRSKENMIYFHTSYHHMDEHGGYDGWTSHTVTIKPDFVYDFEIQVHGSNRNDIKEYIAETFTHILMEKVEG